MFLEIHLLSYPLLMTMFNKGGHKMNPYACITGATSGIGLATAKALARKKYDLVLAARNEEKLQQIKSKLEQEEHIKVTTYVLDVQDPDVVTDCLSRFGAPDVLVNDAGLARGLEPYGDTDTKDILQMIDTNIKGLFLVTHAFLPAMLKRNKGHIINLGSTAGLYAYQGAAVYCATKAAVKTFSDGIRIDVIDSDKKRAAAVYEGIDALQAEDIANIIAFAIDQPKRVQISDIVIMANQQATGFMVSKKKS